LGDLKIDTMLGLIAITFIGIVFKVIVIPNKNRQPARRLKIWGTNKSKVRFHGLRKQALMYGTSLE